jgi:hypothetical protein
MLSTCSFSTVLVLRVMELNKIKQTPLQLRNLHKISSINKKNSYAY